MPSPTTLRLGTRASALARWQAEWVAAALSRLPDVNVELVPISTVGDRQQQGPIGSLGAQGVFTKEIQRALLANEIDLAVHSLKDLPTAPTPGLVLACVPERAAHGDVLVSRVSETFAGLPRGAVLGTGSQRRQAQLLHARPDLQVRDIRGNVDTRLSKLDDGQYDAIILAAAGLERLTLAERITQRLPTSLILPAVGQGALGLETRSDDAATRQIVGQLDHPATHASVLAERSLLAALRGGCLAPVGAWGRVVSENQLSLKVHVYQLHGSVRIDAAAAATLKLPAGGSATGSAPDAESAHHLQGVALGQQVAELLLDQGAGQIVGSVRDGVFESPTSS